MAVDLEKFTAACTECWAQRVKVDEMTREVNEESKRLEELKSRVLGFMEEAGIEKQHIPGFGTLSAQTRFSVKVPQGDGKREFFEYLRSLGIFEDLATVNSQTLNGWYKERLDEAIEKGDLGFRVPGIEEPKSVKTLGFRRG